MDPSQVKQEPAETTVLSSLPPAENPENAAENPENAAGKNPENAAENPENAAGKNPENAAENPENAAENPENAAENPENAAGNTAANKKHLSLNEAKEFTARLRRGDNGLTEVDDPVALAKKTFIELTENLYADLSNLDINEQKPRKLEVFNAEQDYNMKYDEQEARIKEEWLKELQEQFSREENESASYTAILKGTVLARLKVWNTDCAMVEVGRIKGGKCYQVFDANLVDQAQLLKAPNYEDINPKKISRAQAALAFAAGYRGGPETLLSTFDIEEFLEPKLPKKSSPDVVPRKKRTTIWMMGHLSEGPDIGPDGKLVRSGLWMMPRSKWEGMRPSKDQNKIYAWGVGRAIRQFHNYQKSLEVEEVGFRPEKTPFSRAGSESAADWREPSTTPQPQGRPDSEPPSEPPRANSMETERATPAPVSGGNPDAQDDDSMETERATPAPVSGGNPDAQDDHRMDM